MFLHTSIALILGTMLFVISTHFLSGCERKSTLSVQHLRQGFQNPPDSTRPGVYWYFMDGNLSRKAMTADLESMKEAGIGHVIFLEVNVGIPRGPVDFLSEEWQELFKHAVREAERLGIEITLGVGPGWSGSGGPWVRPEQSMQHLVAGSVEVKGPTKYKSILPKPAPRRPYFGEGVFTKKLRQQWQSYYQDVFVLAFPTPAVKKRIADADEKALYYRAPYTSRPGVKPYLPAPAHYADMPAGSAIEKEKIIDLTNRLQADGRLEWDVPPGRWTIMRFGMRNNGAVTRPAPVPGLGFEVNKFDAADFDAHFNAFIGKLLKKVGPRTKKTHGGWTMLHIDSWEMGAQNWTRGFRREFKARRGYDPLPFLPAYTGRIVGNLEISERFLWDVRLTAQELVLENHARHIKELGRKYGLGLSIEPYDMNPCADLDLGAVADVPMGEFWSKGYGFNSAFSCIEATSIAHINGLPVVAAEAFTAGSREAWKLYPGALKNQGDWAFCTGINSFFYHTFAHKPLGDQYRPGMTMGPYGVHWDRGQTWWPMVPAYHKYISRCSFMLQQGNTVADVLYLTPEGAPNVFRPPSSAIAGNDTIPDRRGYNFDGCSPNMLMSKASVRDHRIVFPGGASYRLLVLPDFETMTPELLDKIETLVKDGAIVVGNPPLKSPSLVDYPECDEQVRVKAEKLWGSLNPPGKNQVRKYGKGTIYWGGDFSVHDSTELYPHYDATAALLKQLGVGKDFTTSAPVRYTHRTSTDLDIYFVSNRENKKVEADCFFRIDKETPELWDPLTGEIRALPDFDWQDGRTRIPMQFEAYQSFFIVFEKNKRPAAKENFGGKNFPDEKFIADVKGPWSISFDPKWGGPENVTFDKLEDWTTRPEQGIKYYSGIAVYHKTFALPKDYIIK
ncbi:MAG: glycosyl hydrolase, partial [Actinobacteria bacterium]|nr:glycosyl hydrolase [Actinomycetota bacterium]